MHRAESSMWAIGAIAPAATEWERLGNSVILRKATTSVGTQIAIIIAWANDISLTDVIIINFVVVVLVIINFVTTGI